MYVVGVSQLRDTRLAPCLLACWWGCRIREGKRAYWGVVVGLWIPSLVQAIYVVVVGDWRYGAGAVMALCNIKSVRQKHCVRQVRWPRRVGHLPSRTVEEKEGGHNNPWLSLRPQNTTLYGAVRIMPDLLRMTAETCRGHVVYEGSRLCMYMCAWHQMPMQVAVVNWTCRIRRLAARLAAATSKQASYRPASAVHPCSTSLLPTAWNILLLGG